MEQTPYGVSLETPKYRTLPQSINSCKADNCSWSSRGGETPPLSFLHCFLYSDGLKSPLPNRPPVYRPGQCNCNKSI